MTACPSDDTLGRIGVEIADGPRFEALEQHIESCPACQSSLERLARQEKGWEAARSPIAPDRADLPEIPGFVIEDELGRGSVGVVYRAWQPRLARRVALKLIFGGPVVGARARDHGLREAHAAARVRDARVVQIHDVGETAGCLFLILEYVPGGSLRDRLEGPIPPAAAALLAEKIAGGVAAVHRAGLLHLDLKPSNILIDSEPATPWESTAPKVADFGIARDADEPVPDGTTLRGPWGTPSYMAPEQVVADRRAIGPASDVYALGAVLYELLTGRPPFRGSSHAETMDQVRHEGPVPPRRLNPSIPLDLDTICTTCLRKEPRRRYASAEALADDLRRWREGRPIAARPISPGERAWRWARRRPLSAALAAALAATLILGNTTLVVLWRRAEAERRRAETLHDVARANYDVASESLREICDVAHLASKDPNTIAWSVPLYLEKALEQTRARQFALSRKNVLDRNGREQLATVDLTLAAVYRNHQRDADARPLLEECVSLWETCLALGSDPDRARAQQLEALDGLGLSGYSLASDADVRRWNATSDAIYARLCDNLDSLERLFMFSQHERELADRLADRSSAARAGRFLEEKRALFESLLASHPDSPALILAHHLTLTALGRRDAPPLAQILASSAPTLSGSARSSLLAAALGEWTARAYGFLSLGPSSDEPDDARAAHAVRFLTGQTAQLDLDADAVDEALRRFRIFTVCAATHLRAVARHDRARGVAARFNAFGEALARAYPDRVGPQLLLCESRLQDSKNARTTGDRAAIDRALRQSLAAGLQAQTLDPNSLVARQFVADRRKRIATFESEVNPAP